MATGHPVLTRIESALGIANDHRPLAIQLLEHLVNYLEQSIEKQAALISLRQAADQRADAESARADKAEADLVALQTQVSADEATLKAANDKLDAEIADEEPATLAASPASADAPTTPVVTTPAAGVTVTVDPGVGTTTHEDSTTGVTTTVDHSTGDAMATTASGQTVPADPVDVATAVAASAAAGVTVGVDTVLGGQSSDLVHADPTLPQ